MAFEVAFPIPAGIERPADYFPPLETWLRLNPQWSVLAPPEPSGERWVLHLRDEQSDIEFHPLGHFVASPERGEWRLQLDLEPGGQVYTVSLAQIDGTASLKLRADALVDDDRVGRTNLALWHRSTHDYMLLSMRTGLGSRLTKFFLDRLWLRLSQPGRRLVFMVIVSEIAALGLFVLWLLWTILFG